jgi:hypothetical protein
VFVVGYVLDGLTSVLKDPMTHMFDKIKEVIMKP